MKIGAAERKTNQFGRNVFKANLFENFYECINNFCFIAIIIEIGIFVTKFYVFKQFIYLVAHKIGFKLSG